jgi:hypothetical protein
MSVSVDLPLQNTAATRLGSDVADFVVDNFLTSRYRHD